MPMNTALASCVAEPHIALVTGAAHGIGKAIAERLARQHFEVIATDIDLAQLTLNQQAWQGSSIRIAHLDCRDRTQVAAILDAAGRIDVVVNNAGVGSPLRPFTDIARADFNDIMQINFIGSFVVAQEAVRRMTRGGRIINIASRGYLGGAGAAHYVASKAAVVGMTRAMAAELRWSGIRVNAIAPGMIDTRALGLFAAPMLDKLQTLEPSGGAAEPTVIADVVAFLASREARFISGQVLLVDGAKSLGIPPL